MISNIAAVEYILALKNPPIASRKLVEYLGNRYPEIFLELHGLKLSEPECVADVPQKSCNVYITDHDANQILLYMYSCEKVCAIKHLRTAKLSHSVSFGLKEAKDILDNLQQYLYSIGKSEFDYPDANLNLSIAQYIVLDEIKRSI